MRSPHAESLAKVFSKLMTSEQGLTSAEAQARRRVYGLNRLPTQEAPSFLRIFARQFLNPLIYVLLAAGAIALALDDLSDALFIGLILIVNAIVGSIQEFGAEKSARALQSLARTKCLCVRDSQEIEIDAEDLVPGDLVRLESGRKVPADLRLVALPRADSHLAQAVSKFELHIDESLLTGESLPVQKNAHQLFDESTALGDRLNMAYAGSVVTKGRADAIVVATGLQTQLGHIAHSLKHEASAPPPLVLRMQKLTQKISWSLVIVCLAMAAILLTRGQTWLDVLMFSVALAVSAIPEGLPVALTVALSVASRRMAKRNVIVRRLHAVEALGSCTMIATDKTGTLTVNQLSITEVRALDRTPVKLEGSGDLRPEPLEPKLDALRELILTGALCNEAQLKSQDGEKGREWIGHGDAVDLAFLVLAHKLPEPCETSAFQLLASVPFEAENQFAATLHEREQAQRISVKGALEKVLAMCGSARSPSGPQILTDAMRAQIIQSLADPLAESGHRVLALASKILPARHSTNEDLRSHLNELCFEGVVGMMDPLRPEAKEALRACREAGIQVAMVTGDHPKTAMAIARQLGLAHEDAECVTGQALRNSATPAELIRQGRVFARVEPTQKLQIVQHLLRDGHFVAVTGDGANDAPALKAANVGIAMGKSGTDLAKETAGLILTDDRFASIVAGIEEGRVAYANIRKVVYLLISTGAAEIIMFFYAIWAKTPLPLTAAQLLWLNLVTNGIQDAALAFEPKEGDELRRPPRSPQEPMFDRIMLERIALSALVMGLVSSLFFEMQLHMGTSVESARNLTLLLMVLFENFMIGNCRSETRSALKISPFSNRFLILGTLGAQLLHIAALYTPGLRDLLQVEPVTLAQWGELLGYAVSVVIVIEIHKYWRSSRRTSPAPSVINT
ncbi:MAG TPA: HAD-IC family P-type ATPase [Pseudobdellovibrionaceae bacterium]|nr:HAD-IC family P-type ATPase [Pseudobdellovibrionaceae bacterium]